MKKKYGFKTLIVLGILALSVYTLIPTIQVLSVPQDHDKSLNEQRRTIFKKENPEIASKAMALGLDLSGGTHMIVEVDNSKSLDAGESSDLLDRSLEIIRNRVDQFGLSEPIIRKSGSNRIVAELAGVNAEEARRLIGATALLEFKLLSEVSEFKTLLDRIDNFLKMEKTSSKNKKKGKIAVNKSKKKEDSQIEDLFGIDNKSQETGTEANTKETLDEFKKRPFGSLLVGLPNGTVGVNLKNEYKVQQILSRPEIKKLIPKRYQILWGKVTSILQTGDKIKPLFYLKSRAEMSGKYISDAGPGRNSTGQIDVSLTFKGKGSKEFSRITGANIGRRLAIVLDSVVYSAPEIQGKITQGRASITGLSDFKEAKLLATTLRAGSLPTKMDIVELRSVGPSLGSENISKGLTAAIWAFVLVVVFMLLYYFGSGLVANLALVFNLLIVGALLSMFHATLTLPGIAGIILTIGMAVDSNVIIFERIREELAQGRSVRNALEFGYKKAFSTIFDSNITTFGTALVLYNIGSGPIRGFGLTLMLGIGASMFTSLVVTRLVFELILNKLNVNTLSIGKGPKFLRQPKFTWMSKTKVFVFISITFIAVSFVYIIFVKGGFNWGVDFKGGQVYEVVFEQDIDRKEISQNLREKGIEAVVRSIGSQGEQKALITLNSKERILAEKIQEALGSQAKIVGQDFVGPRIGKGLQWSALKSFLMALVLIIIYIWVRFGRNGLGFGLAAVVALFHDILVTWAIFGLLDFEISLIFVAACLTIVGYSLNDTIVIFDRIRENTDLSGKQKYIVQINDSINQSLSRTIITTFTTLIVVVFLAIFGGDAVCNFAIAMIIGVVVGTYSSVGVASPFVLWWHNRKN